LRGPRLVAIACGLLGVHQVQVAIDRFPEDLLL
jgi:hypothetical protein